uniref:CARD domain-containing protein n=1 Tax=Anser brachyrhynchus TaxID=132585 RepID=A0A8B9I0W7_9AVES
MGYLLRETLEELGRYAFPRFKRELSKIQPKEQYERIELESLMGLSRAALAELLCSHYGQPYCVEVTVKVLRAMGRSTLAYTLLTIQDKKVRNIPDKSAPDHSPFCTSPPCAPGQHFVEKHREQLIQRVTSVSRILDQLLQYSVLTDEQYETIRAKSTRQEQMRRLYSFMPSWNTTCKDHFLDALKETSPYLIQELQGS